MICSNRYPRELALINAIEANLATLGGDPHARAAYELTVILFEQCGAYKLALRQIAALADEQKSCPSEDIFNVLDNLDQPL